MRSDGELVVAAGFASLAGPRADNQDFGGVHLGTALERARHGIVAIGLPLKREVKPLAASMASR